jgi:hypothetical protein
MTARAADINQAQRDRGCLNFENQLVHLESGINDCLSILSTLDQTDCGADGRGYKISSNGDIISNEVRQLPEPSFLIKNERHEYAADHRVEEWVIKLESAGVGGLVGVSGFLVLGSYIRDTIRRRRSI